MNTTPDLSTAQRLYALLPAIYRVRDAANGFVLRELVEVLAGEAEVLGEELDQLYDDQFIETCASWAAPYLGDLIGYRVLNSAVTEVASPRAEVANTVAYRRRKGTAAVLEQLARDVTGWPTRAVEFFERVVTTQYMNHPRPHARATADLRNPEALHWITDQNGGFDDLAHTADVRRIAAGSPSPTGRHNIPNIGLFLWRTEAVRVTRAPLVAHDGDARRFRFDPLGADRQLYGAPRTEDSITHLAEPEDVPLPLGRRWLSTHRDAYYGAGSSLLLETQTGNANPVAVAMSRLKICDLSDVPGAPGSWAHAPTGTDVAVDPVLGRVYFGTAPAPGGKALGTYHFGQAVPVGAAAPGRPSAQTVPQVTAISDGADLTPGLGAIAAGGTLLITDSGRYAQPVTISATTAAAGDPDTVVCVAAENGTRPSIVAAGPVQLAMAARTTVILDGLLISGGPLVLEEVGDAETRTIMLRNCTLVPGQTRGTDGKPKQPDRASLLVLDPFAEVVIERCVLGPIVAVEGSRLTLHDSAVDASAPEAVAFCGRDHPAGGAKRRVQTTADQQPGGGTTPGGGLDLHECTVIGGIHCTRLDASNSLLLAQLAGGDPRPAAVHARRKQVGCVRYSYLPAGSRTGKRYRCQPDPSDPPAARLAAKPRFTSLRFGDPAYLQLSQTSAAGIRRGADDEAEMGVTHLLYTPQREANLLLRLDEYLRFGLEAGFFYA
jgi:hypothetical protein